MFLVDGRCILFDILYCHKTVVLDIGTLLEIAWSPTMLEAIKDGAQLHPAYPFTNDLVEIAMDGHLLYIFSHIVFVAS